MSLKSYRPQKTRFDPFLMNLLDPSFPDPHEDIPCRTESVENPQVGYSITFGVS